MNGQEERLSLGKFEGQVSAGFEEAELNTLKAVGGKKGHGVEQAKLVKLGDGKDGGWNAEVGKSVRCNPAALTAGAGEAIAEFFDDVGGVVVFQDNFAPAFELVGSYLGT